VRRSPDDINRTPSVSSARLGRPAVFRTQLTESLGALQVTLIAADLARREEALPPSEVAGARYDEHQMRILDSER
jgi:hypothetical protein